MKKVFLILAMFMCCSLFAEVIQHKTYTDYFDNQISPGAQFSARFNFIINLQEGTVNYRVLLSTKENNGAFYYLKESDSISEFEEIYNELNYVIKYVLPTGSDNLLGVELKKADLMFFVRNSAILFGNLFREGDCVIPFNKIQFFADVIKNVIDKFYEHQKDLESVCFPVKPFSK